MSFPTKCFGQQLPKFSTIEVLCYEVYSVFIWFYNNYSAGIGRTGIFIAIDTEMQHMKKKGVIDVCNCVCNMRFWRHFIVQTVVSWNSINYIVMNPKWCEIVLDLISLFFSLSTILFTWFCWSTLIVELPLLLLQLIMLKKSLMNYLL